MLPIVLATACDSGTEVGSDTGSETGSSGDCVENEEIIGTITDNTTWSCNKVLADIVTVEEGVTLTVDPGVSVLGKSGSALVVKRSGKLIAEGTADAPIVFTSSQAEGRRARGDWGGIVLLGEASNNLPNSEGQPEGLEGSYAYGGSDDSSSCGTLHYVRVEFAGYELTTDNELNGITFYSCGQGTEVSYVQVHMGADDGLEMFGGAFDASHLVVTGALDDSIDMDQGYRGNLQYVFVQQDPTIGNYAFEISNQGADLQASPRTQPRIANATVVGTGSEHATKSAGILFKEGAAGEFYNLVMTNFYGTQVELTHGATEQQAADGTIKIDNSLFFQNALASGAEFFATDPESTFDLQGFVEGFDNMFEVDPMLSSITWGAPNITPAPSSPAMTAAAPPSGFEPSPFIGAVGDTNWMDGWTTFVAN